MSSSGYGGRRPPEIQGMVSLKVDNLSYRTTPEDLKPIFDKYGEVGDIYIPRDHYTKESRGFAFIRYYDKRDAEDAMERLDGYVLDGRDIRVQLARYGRPSDSHMRHGGGRDRGYGGGRDRGYGGYSAPRRSYRRYSRSRSRSRSPRRRRSSPRRRSYSRSRSRSPRYSRSRRHYSRSHSRSASRSRSPSRSKSRSSSPGKRRQRSVSRSPRGSPDLENGRRQSRSKSRSRDPSDSPPREGSVRNNSHSRSRSRSGTPE